MKLLFILVLAIWIAASVLWILSTPLPTMSNRVITLSTKTNIGSGDPLVMLPSSTSTPWPTVTAILLVSPTQTPLLQVIPPTEAIIMLPTLAILETLPWSIPTVTAAPYFVTATPDPRATPYFVTATPNQLITPYFATATPDPRATPYFVTATPTTVPTMVWYDGGTLHNATIAEWRGADLRNKIATAADWATTGLGLTTLEQIQISTTKLLACIETTFDTYAQLHNASDSITDLVITCLFLLQSEAAATPTATSLPITLFPNLGQLPVCDCSANLYNCPDFSGHAAAQACFDFCVAQNVGDIHDLDRDKDNLACDDS